MLLIDSGNSSIKCRLIEEDKTQDRTFDLYKKDGWSLFSQWLARLDVSDIYLASVASTITRQQIVSRLGQYSSARLHHLQTLAQLDGISNGYHDYRQLGVDRWLGVIGASEVVAGDAIIIDAGSAITIDLLSRQQGYLGGVILPGFHCDQERFEQIFPTVDFANLPAAQQLTPGLSTLDCLRPQPAPASIASILCYIDAFLPLLGESADLLLCGQDAQQISTALERPHRTVTDLVFTGMLKQIACLG